MGCGSSESAAHARDSGFSLVELDALCRGFTLIELMIAVVVVSILAAISMSTYQKQVIKGRRRDAESVMMDLANREQQFLVANRSYANTTTLTASGYSPPPDVTQYYGWGVASSFDANGSPLFIITMTPTGAQASDGALTLDQSGIRQPSSKW